MGLLVFHHILFVYRSVSLSTHLYYGVCLLVSLRFVKCCLSLCLLIFRQTLFDYGFVGVPSYAVCLRVVPSYAVRLRVCWCYVICWVCRCFDLFSMLFVYESVVVSSNAACLCVCRCSLIRCLYIGLMVLRHTLFVYGSVGVPS